MKKNTVILIIIALAVIAGIFFIFQRSANHKNLIQNFKLGNMKLTSPAFEPNQSLPKPYTCGGKNVNPPLIISGVPDGAKSLALIVDDPDSPSGDFSHWLVWNISPDTREIAENSVPNGAAVGLNDFGRSTYDGPCPPSGVHRYNFKLYALSDNLVLDENTNKNKFKEALNDRVLEQAVLTGLYKR
ncbi:YbhB/YbcL family Raf kinase inhibitor-like protein [Candidatus Falkowbacteria bacterium]|nr:YbhB/YbcL family Raf kinase inhibitor-like protein [Candidatus Falkowbacteria bacterium]